jgi:hypothetical protein
MSEYNPKWSNIPAIEKVLQFDIKTDSKPTIAEVTEFIEEVETGMTANNLGTQTTLSGTQFDVFPSRGMAKNTIGWFQRGRPIGDVGRTVVPPYAPIISINSGTMQRNKASLQSTPDWETLKNVEEFPTASDNDYLIMYTVNKITGKRVGHSIYFFQNHPTAGRNRLRAQWVYGQNIDEAILREYATLKVAEKIILVRLFAGVPANTMTYTAGADMNTYVNAQYEAHLLWIQARIEEIEKRNFPKETPIVVMQGI